MKDISVYNLFERADDSEMHDPQSTISFLPHHGRGSADDDDHPVLEKGAYGSQQKPLHQRRSFALFVHLPLLVANILITIFLVMSWSRGNHTPDLVSSPLQTAVKYKKDLLTDQLTFLSNGTMIPDPVYKEFGPPSPELDDAWTRLLQYSNVRLHDDELNEDFRHNPGLVRLSDGSGIYGTVAVFHSIHCIKRLRFLLHFDHYHANVTETQATELKLHGEHCLSYLLHSAKCNADLTVFPMQWGERTRVPFGVDSGHHQCKDFDRIQDWMKERSFDIYKPGLLNHPTLGWAYSQGVKHVTGVEQDEIISNKGHGGHDMPS